MDGERIRFTHPLFAAVTYARVDDGADARFTVDSPGSSRTTREGTPSRALGRGPDEVVATALENAAAVALARGASAAAAELSEQALSLTPLERESDVRRRTIATARHRFRTGDATAALALLERALPSMPLAPIALARSPSSSACTATRETSFAPRSWAGRR